MKCPRCESAMLLERERDGVMIDACPDCRGLWLDRGELEKLIARAQSEFDEYSHSKAHKERRREESRYDRSHRKKKRGSWFESLGDLFGD